MAGRFCTERQLCFVFYTDNEAAIVTIQQPLSRESWKLILCILTYEPLRRLIHRHYQRIIDTENIIHSLYPVQ